MAEADNEDQTTRCLASIRERLDAGSGPRQAPTIFKVLPNIREANSQAFEPQMVSFGPYHQGKDRLRAMEEQKWLYLRKFLQRNPNKQLKDYFSKIKSVVDQVRLCYWDEVEVEDNLLAKMLLLDGSLIVELLLMRSEEPPSANAGFDPITSTNCFLSLIAHDMLKLENQVPFIVLESLYDILSTNNNDLILSIYELAYHFITHNFIEEHISMEKPPQNEPPHHLLHLFHSCIIHGLNNAASQVMLIGIEEHQLVESIATAQELKEAGIKFKKKTKGGFLEVTFSDGVMEMTPLVIDEETSTILHNLIAFEQYCPNVGPYVTGYGVYLDCLIDTPADVQMLRLKGMIENKLGSDEEAALFATRLCRHVAVGEHQLSELFQHVERYCHSRMPRWRAKLRHDYFGNPWALISLVTAVILLLLTAIQAIFAVISYHK